MGGVLCAQRLSSRRPGGAKARGLRAARSGGAWDGACQARRGRGRHRTAASESLRVPAGKVPLGQLPRRPMEGGVRIDGHVLAGVDDDAQVHHLRPTPSLSPPRLQALGTTWRDGALGMSPPPGRQPTLQPRGGRLRIRRGPCSLSQAALPAPPPRAKGRVPPPGAARGLPAAAATLKPRGLTSRHLLPPRIHARVFSAVIETISETRHLMTLLS